MPFLAPEGHTRRLMPEDCDLGKALDTKNELIIGRGSTCDVGLAMPDQIGPHEDAALRLALKTTSRTHAQIYRDDGVYYIECLDAPNGVYLNGARITGPESLFDLDLISFGSPQEKTAARFYFLAKRQEPVD